MAGRTPREPVAEPIDQASSDLAYELQSKLFDQLAAMGTAGAGLTITLIGTVLKGASPIIWLAVIEFVIAALVALSAQLSLIEGLFCRVPTRRRSRIMTQLAMALIGMGIGSLGTSVLLLGHTA
jgi:hypothetical protein